MKFIWEEKDFAGDSWGLMAERGEEIIVIGGLNCTSLRDGHTWNYSSYQEMTEAFNSSGMIPVLAPINPSVVIKAAADKKFNYGSGL